jgi:hypothetical protein
MRTNVLWFDPNAFRSPVFAFGNFGRNVLRAAPVYNCDLSLIRKLRLGEIAQAQFRFEAFNALNKVNLGTPNRFVNTAQFGTITESSTPGRVIQISARFFL